MELFSNTTTVAQKSTIQDNFSLEVTVLGVIRGVISLFGIIGNSLTIRTFVAMGLKDGVTLSFLFLSISDLLYLTSMLASTVSYIFLSVELLRKYSIYFPIDPYGVNIYFLNCGSGLYLNTTLTITFLSIARCLSVAKPLWFRNASGKLKITIIFMIISSSICVALSIPTLALMGIIPKADSKINGTRPTLWISPLRKLITAITWPIGGSVIPFSVQFILIFCIGVMTFYLKKALQFREKFTQATTLKTTDENESTENEKVEANKSVKLKGRELQIVKQMLIISLVFVTCNIPKISVNTTIFLVPEYSIDGAYGKLYEAFDMVRNTFQVINSSSNIFVYYKYNSRFRKLFWK
ncbi:uncharacterized protein LOC131934809 [Physella acuta]|uniref:uncharacterized protein LOC131934809 n=1 Tax=Physella acuta TaxID=109671 RepID=UPI0027DAFBC5|nr:uncharacterized protein LOC131934809 [Physella acuta]